jgi:hypothetical protein
LVTHLLATAALWVRIQTFLNTKMVDIAKEWPTHSRPSKNIQKYLSSLLLGTLSPLPGSRSSQHEDNVGLGHYQVPKKRFRVQSYAKDATKHFKFFTERFVGTGRIQILRYTIKKPLSILYKMIRTALQISRNCFSSLKG